MCFAVECTVCFFSSSCQRIEPSDFLSPSVGIRRLEYYRDIVETRVVHHHVEELLADGSPKQRCVAVNSRTALALGVIQMYGAEIGEADGFVKLAPCLLIPFGRRQVITGRKGMAGVDAYAYTGLVFDAADYAAYLLESESEICALSGRILDDGLHA